MEKTQTISEIMDYCLDDIITLDDLDPKEDTNEK